MIENSKSFFTNIFEKEELDEFVWNFLIRINRSNFVLINWKEYIFKSPLFYEGAPNYPDQYLKNAQDRMEEIVEPEESIYFNWSLLAMTGPLKESLFIDEQDFRDTIKNFQTSQSKENTRCPQI